MVRVLLVVLMLVLSGLPAAAFDTPKALLTALYAPYLKGPKFDWSNWDETQFRSARLNDLFARDAAETGGLGRLDFDPYVDGESYQLSGLKIGEPVAEGDLTRVEVTFKNFGTPTTLTFALVQEAEGWRVDDVVSADPNFPYSLAAILSAPL